MNEPQWPKKATKHPVYKQMDRRVWKRDRERGAWRKGEVRKPTTNRVLDYMA